ncbi:MAG: flagellar biosynthesis protein FlhB [Planctomycetaceae bacterium]
MSDGFGDKTEEPTERRRNEARQKGNVARSVDLNAAGLMLAVAMVLMFFGGQLALSLAEFLRVSIEVAADPISRETAYDLDRAYVVTTFRDILSVLARIVLPMMVSLFAAAVALNVLQVGFLLSPEALQVKWSRINPLEGLKRIISFQGLVKLAVSLLKLALLVAIGAWVLVDQLPYSMDWADGVVGPPAPGAVPVDALMIATDIGDNLVMLAFLLALALVILGLMDFAFQKWKHEQDLKMTKQEVRDEFKQMEGDPTLRQRRRDAHRKIAQARELNQVQDADIVITNPTHIAVALQYDPETMPAPIVVAKGMGLIADRIRKIAVSHGVPIIERKPLARSLYHDVKVGQAIPIEMYEAFVEIMAFVYELAGETPESLRLDSA